MVSKKVYTIYYFTFIISQTKINLTKMESFQRYKTPVEGQNQTEQRYMEMLAYAV